MPNASYGNILLIDDDVDDQEIFMAAMDAVSDAVNCTMLNSAVEAITYLSNNAPPDLIFLDLNMPVMTGQQFLTKVKQCEGLKNIPVIVLSTSSHQPTIEHVKELGAIDFITKPDKFNELVTILKSIIN